MKRSSAVLRTIIWNRRPGTWGRSLGPLETRAGPPFEVVRVGGRHGITVAVTPVTRPASSQGSPEEHTVLEFAQLIESLVGK